MSNPKVIIMAMNKAQKEKEVKKDGAKEKEVKRRLLKVFQDELGAESSKMGEGDIVEFRVLGKLASKGRGGMDTEVHSVSLYSPETEKKILSNPIPSPSA